MTPAAWTKTSWCQTVFVTGREQQTTARFTFQLRLSRVTNTLSWGFISLDLDPYLFQIFQQVCRRFTQCRQTGNTRTQKKKQLNQLMFHSFINSHSNKILLSSSSSPANLHLNITETTFCVYDDDKRSRQKYNKQWTNSHTADSHCTNRHLKTIPHLFSCPRPILTATPADRSGGL